MFIVHIAHPPTVDLNEIATVVKHLSRKRNASGQLDSHVSAYNSVWTLYG